ncbi:TPA: hypothetical protein ACNTVS_004179, partial [Escherichia coli]
DQQARQNKTDNFHLLISHIYPRLEYRGIVLFCSTIFITFTQNILRLVSSLLMMFYHACKD